MMGSKEARVMVAVSGHWLVGSMPSTGTRIQDVLKDGATDFVNLTDVQVCRYAERESCLATLSEVLIPKCMIEIVVVFAGRHEAPTKRWNNLAARATANVFAIVSKYCIQGELHVPTSSHDSLSILTHQLGKFFAITRASMSGPGIKPLSVPLLLANKDFVNCFHVGEPANVGTTPVEAATESPQPEAGGFPAGSLVQLAEGLHGLLGEADSGTDLQVNSPVG